MAGLSLALDTPDLAAHYDRASVDRQFKFGKQLIELLGIEPGARVLDVGSGTGLLAEHVASLVGASGSVVGVDPLPLRIELAKRKAKPNLSFAVDNAYVLEQFELREQARREVLVELDRLKTPDGIRQTGARIVAVAVKR